MYVETSKSNFASKSQGIFQLTGNIGKVMNESSNIALTYAKYFIHKYLKELEWVNKENTVTSFLEENQIHVHFTEGAIAKDGPSAGVTITTALLSLALNTPILQNLAMTGEISLGGKV